MKTTLSLFSVIVFSFLFTSCTKPKPEIVKVGEMSEYADPAFGFKIKYPQQWKSMGEAGKALFYESDDVRNNFLDYVGGKRTGSEISVIAKRGEGGKKGVDLLPDAMLEIQSDGNTRITKEESITLVAMQVKKVSYETPITTKLSLYGYSLYIPIDSLLFEVKLRAFGDYFDAYNDVFAAVQNSFVPPVIIAKTDDRPRPSETFSKNETPYFTFEYPENFNFIPTPKGDKDFVLQIRGERLDCSIQFDVFAAKDLTVEKVFEQNKGKYKAKSTGESEVNGLKALFVNYAPAKDIDSRAYFMVKNNKVIRITMNWFSPEKELYLAAFERVVNSLKAKDTP
ncbi:MAG: hypothetical protein KGZ58_02980 [Ignavibacteriales bacterium]|nr:hypothetical protein [Ignavibacteriales bacterium]